MKVFNADNYPLTTASTNLRLVLTFMGYLTNLLTTYRQAGFAVEGISTWYRDGGMLRARCSSTRKVLTSR